MGAANARKLQRGYAGSTSAPSFAMEYDVETTSNSKEELEKQKLRVACKMEILEFFNGYSNSGGKMSAEQTKLLLDKLHRKSDWDIDQREDCAQQAECPS